MTRPSEVKPREGDQPAALYKDWTVGVEFPPLPFTITPDIVRAVGRALGSLAQERGRDTIVVGRDGRLSGPALSAALADGIRSSGANVVDVGMVATLICYFAAYQLGTHCCAKVIAEMLGCDRLIIDPQLAGLVDGDQDPASLVTLVARLRRVRQMHVRSLPHLRRHHHEDDQQHEHYVDKRRDINGRLHLGWLTEPHGLSPPSLD